MKIWAIIMITTACDAIIRYIHSRRRRAMCQTSSSSGITKPNWVSTLPICIVGFHKDVIVDLSLLRLRYKFMVCSLFHWNAYDLEAAKRLKKVFQDQWSRPDYTPKIMETEYSDHKWKIPISVVDGNQLGFGESLFYRWHDTPLFVTWEDLFGRSSAHRSFAQILIRTWIQILWCFIKVVTSSPEYHNVMHRNV